MGVNYYIIGYNEKEKNRGYDSNPKWHIGKISAAGSFCNNCNSTLKVGGAARVHQDDEWYEKCPICGGDGTNHVVSFTFAMSPVELKKRIAEEFGDTFTNKKTIVNEYNEELRFLEFLELLEKVPSSLYFWQSLGQEFS